MKLLFLLLPILYLGGNAYVYVRALQSIAILPLWTKIVVSVVYWLVVLSLIVALFGREILPSWLLQVMYVGGSVWLVFTLYMVFTLLIFDAIKLFFPTLKFGFWCALGFTMCLLAYGYYNYRNPTVNELKITLEKPLESSVRVVALSDVHLGYATGKKQLKKYVELINSQKPDIILIAGDLIDNSVLPVRSERMSEELSLLNATMGVYMVPGNHEYISGIDEVVGFLKNTPITLLRDTIVTLPCGLQIMGRDDKHNKRRMPLRDIVEKTDSSKPIVMLDHQPYQVAKKDSLGVDVQISGHTHRGQVFPMNLLVDAMYEQSHGYRKWSHSHVYVSSGLSLWGPPFRIGTSSDIAVIDFYGNNK